MKPVADFLPCGHMNYQDVFDDPEMTHDIARRSKSKVKCHTVYVETPGKKTCPACKDNLPGNPRYQEGKYKKPVPDHLRRTQEKQDGPCFSGLCTDPKTHLYIGGPFNDCRKVKENKRLCIVHDPKKKKKRKEDAEL